ncbi:hypothetical protein, partial [Synechocystis salina]|uniref:hypothetical protein n=1 Tax=Synechocystis salina TaxID=945780 RepID=UPI001D132920
RGEDLGTHVDPSSTPLCGFIHLGLELSGVPYSIGSLKIAPIFSPAMVFAVGQRKLTVREGY